MTTKTCNNCGWVLDIRDKRTKCPVCGTRFEYGICRVCGKPVKYYRHDRIVCKLCYDTVIRKPGAMERVYQRRREKFEEWKSKIASIPKDYPSLTEAQWLAAVKHFNGCALCGSEDVDTRGYFIHFSHGGRYCDWNIIPTCEKCAAKTTKPTNPFLNRPAGLNGIVEYLEEKVNAAIEKSSNEADRDNNSSDGSK